jgi:zinc transporter ZupT
MNVSGEDIRAAQMITGTTLTLFVMVGVVPALRSYAGRIRLVIAVAFFAVAAGFMVYLMVR